MEAQAALCDIRFKLQLAITEVAVENIRDRYREQLHWESTVLGIIETIESQKFDTVSEVVNQLATWYDWQEEHSRTVEFNRILREIIMLEDPSMLPYKDCVEVEQEDVFGVVHKVLINGETDDCREVTYQYVAAHSARYTVVSKSKTTYVDSEPEIITVTVEFCNKMNMLAAARYLDQKKKDEAEDDEKLFCFEDLYKNRASDLNEIEVVRRTYTTTTTRKIIATEYEDIPEAVEPAGPEYYFTSQPVKIEEEPKAITGKDKEDTKAEEMKYHFNSFSHVAKQEHQLKGTESNYESIIMRSPLYNDSEGFKTSKALKPLGKVLLELMKIVWTKMDNRSIVSFMLLHDELGPKRHPEGYWTKAKDPYHSLPKALYILKRNGYVKFVDVSGISIEKKGIIDPKYTGDIYVQALESGPGITKTIKRPMDGYSMRQLGVIDYDADMGTYKGSIEPHKYRRYGEWHTRVGVLMNPINSKMPLFVSEDWKPETEYENYLVYKEDRTEEWSRIVNGGIAFYNSAQLHPPHGADYDPSGQFSMKTDWSKVVSTAFLARLYSGNLSQKWVVTNKEGKTQRFTERENAWALYQYNHDEETMAFYEFNDEDKTESEFYKDSLVSIREPGTQGGVCTHPSRKAKWNEQGNMIGFDYEYKRQAWMSVKLPRGTYGSNDPRRIVLFVDIQIPKTKSGQRIMPTGSWRTKTVYA